MDHKFEAGRLQYFVNEWHKIPSDPNILDVVAHCHLDKNVADIGPLFTEEIEYIFSEKEQCIIGQEIVKLLQLKVIKETHREEEQLNSFPHFSA